MDTIQATDEQGLLVKAHVINVEHVGETSQREDDAGLGTPDEAIAPPESLEGLALLSTFNGTRRSCIGAIARNTVGLGYDLEVAEGHERDGQADSRQQIAEATASLEACAGRDTRLDSPSVTELLMAVKWDEEEVGNGYLEVSRSRIDGLVDGLFHIPGKRTRRLKSRKGYILLPPGGDLGDMTWFAPFGSKVIYRSGKPTSKLAPGHEGGWRRNEIIPFKLYSSESRDYGMPRDAGLALEYVADKAAVESNVGYFDQGGALPTVLFVQGEERREGGEVNVTVPLEVTQRIHAVLSSKGGRGPTGTGRVAVIPLPAGVKAQKEVLGQISERDIGFVDFRSDQRQRTLSAFTLGPIFIGLLGDAQYSAEVQRALGKEQVFDPEQERYQRRLTELVLRDLGYPDLAMRFRDLAVEDDAARRSSVDKMAEVGTVRRREHREAHGFPPLPEASKAETEIEWGGALYKSEEPEGGQVPHGWNDELVNVGKPNGAENRVEDGTGQQGVRPGLGGRDSRDRGQAASAVQGQTRRLAGRNGKAGQAGAKRALERARTLPTG